MEIDEPLFDKPMRIVSNHGDIVWVSAIDRRCAQIHAETLVNIHNLIPFVRWTRDDLLRDQLGARVFHNKWNLSLLITRKPEEPVGFLISYLRHADSNLDCLSVYMHRMALLTPLQRRGIGRQVISNYLTQIFLKLTVDYVSLQANDTPENARIIALYEGLGFRKHKRVLYPDKTDWLMVCGRPKGTSAI